MSRRGLEVWRIDGDPAPLARDNIVSNTRKQFVATFQMRGKLINALESVSEAVGNYDQLEKTTGVLGSVTAVTDEVTEDSKVKK